MHAFPNCRILCRKSEGVESLRMQHVVAFHALEPGGSVAAGEREPVSDVQVARRVGEHRLDEPLGLVVVFGAPTVDACIFPICALLRFDFGRVVAAVIGNLGGRGRSSRGLFFTVHSVIRLV